MIQKIRKCHRLIWLILAMILPLLFIAGIWLRHSEPTNEKIPNKLNPEAQRSREN